MRCICGAALLLVLTAGLAQAQVGLRMPADTISLAAVDAARHPYSGKARTIRWLDMASFTLAQREDAYRVLCGHVQHLSRASDITRPAVVQDSGGSLLRIDLEDYGISRSVWEQLSDPYFHQLSKVTTTERKKVYAYWQGGWHKGQHYPPGNYYEWQDVVVATKITTILGPWLTLTPKHKLDLQFLIEATGSQVPVVNAGWFFQQSAAQVDRKPGYYDFLGVADRKGYEKAIGYDRKQSRGFSVEVRAAVSFSGVSSQPRALARDAALGGGYYATFDYKLALAGQNPLRVFGRLLDEKFDATETVAFLPNGFIAWGLFDRQGKRQDVAPDFVGRDSLSRSNDGRIHVNVSCVRCHYEGGIKPIDDYVRDLVKPPFLLQSKDYHELRLLRQQYLRQLEPFLAKDRMIYEQAVKEATGLDAKTYSAKYAAMWETTEDVKVDMDWYSRHTGVPVKRLQEAVAKSVAAGYGDPVLAAVMRGRTVPRRQAEEVIPLLWETVMKAGVVK